MSAHGGQAARLRGCAPLHSGMREHVAGAHPHASHPAEAWLFIINLALFRTHSHKKKKGGGGIAAKNKKKERIGLDEERRRKQKAKRTSES